MNMTMARTAALTVLPGLLVLAVPAGAHHSFSAVYDQQKPLRIEGIVERLEWRSPHAVLHVVSVDDAGATATWSFEMGAPRVLTQRLGWSADEIKRGDRITVEGFLAREGDRHGAAQYVTTASGERLLSVLPFR